MNKNILKKTVSIAATCIMTLSLFAVSGTEVKVSAASVQEKINAATKQKQEALDNINKSKTQKKEAMAQKDKLDAEIDLLNDELSQIDAIIAEADKNIAAKEAEIADYEKKIQENDDAFRARLRAMDEMNNSTYIDMLLNAESIGDFLSTVETIREISEHDQAIIDQMIVMKTGVENSKAEIERSRAEQKEARDLTASKKAQLNKKMSEKNSLISKLDSDIKEYEKAYNDATAQENSLKASLQASLSKSTGGKVYTGGTFCWPAPSYTYISSPYGYRIHPKLGVSKFHSGVDMAAPGGTNILAAADGVVRSAGYNGGYGNCLVIDHGGGIATLYGHARKLLVSSGQSVKKGQVIALVGTTGMSTGNHLHFEVLKNGVTTDPMAYFN